MSFFDEKLLGNFTCSQCGNVYKIVSKSLPDKELEGFDCECGNAIIEKHRTRSNYMPTLIGKGKTEDAANNPQYR